LTQEQIVQNFDVGVGEKFFLLFAIGDISGVPADSYIVFEVAQFDSYSYLFDKATYINLDPAVTPSNIPLMGMRIGINGSEATVGQAYRNLDTSIDGASYDPATGQPLSSLGTIIALENGPDSDEFFLTFEVLGDQTNVVTEVSPLTPPPLPAPDPVSDIGVRTFDEINASMAAITGVDPQAVKAEVFDIIRQQLPAVETIEAFLSAHQMAIAQLGIAYCDALVEDPDTSKRADFFGFVDVASANAFFTSPVATAFSGGAKSQIAGALFDRVMGLPGSVAPLATAPSLTDLTSELIGPNPDNLFDRLAANCLLATDPPCSPDAARTGAIVKSMCGSVLSSAAMLVQ
jgi:hypothetical protein